MTVPENEWRKASRSSTANVCVELSPLGAVRDSKNPEGPVLPVNLPALVAAVKTGQLG